MDFIQCFIIDSTETEQVFFTIDSDNGGKCKLTLEELFGNFEDEFDIDKNEYKEISKGIYLVNAKMNCKDFNNIAGDVIPKGNYETIAGYIISDLGRIPHRGEHFFTKIGHIIIKKASARYIEQVMIYLENNKEEK